MRWDMLFGDLDAQWHAATQLELEGEVNELARVEAAQITLVEALRGSLGRVISVLLRDGNSLHGTLQRVEAQWLLLDSDRLSAVVPVAKLLQVRGMGPDRVAESGGVRYTLASALRLLARNRAVVVLGLETSAPTSLRGVLDQVGADFVVITQLADGVGRGRDNRLDAVTVPLAALISVRSSTENEF